MYRYPHNLTTKLDLNLKKISDYINPLFLFGKIFTLCYMIYTKSLIPIFNDCFSNVSKNCKTTKFNLNLKLKI